MRFIYLAAITSLILSSCNTVKEEKSTLSDSSSVSVMPDSTMPDNKVNAMEVDSVIETVTVRDSVKSGEKKTDMKKSIIDIKTFKNTDLSGYGYDILIDGRMYVHQPNIPALPGNNGFASEEQAKKVAGLVANKIRNNIMPPTVEVKELDSLGIK